MSTPPRPPSTRARRAYAAKFESLNQYKDEQGEFADRLLALVMLNVLDEKWKDHLYDLDQLRNAIHYRSWGQKDPLIEYKEEAYAMFVDLMHDIYTHVRRALPARPDHVRRRHAGNAPPPPARPVAAKPTKRYNALGVLEEVAENEEPQDAPVEAVAPASAPIAEPAPARGEPVIVGAGRPRSLQQPESGGGAVDWSNVGRNDPCPCGSGKKFKKCHGAAS